MKVISVVGARPQFVKLAPIASALAAHGHDHFILHTGQHYDARMSQSFFQELSIPDADLNLDIGSGSHGAQTAAMLQAIEAALLNVTGDWVLVYGDTNSTLAGTLAATKLHRPVAHLEAGLRSFNRSMPEELNRVATDHLSDLLLAPTDLAAANLSKEGLDERVIKTGDVMADVCLQVSELIGELRPPLPIQVDDAEEFVLATIHRPVNTDDSIRLDALLNSLSALPQQVVLAAHPRLVARAREFKLPLERAGIALVQPFTYPEMIAALKTAAAVVTDSGGIQKEAYILGTPCTTIRTETEWVETLEDGWNVLENDPNQLMSAVARPPRATVRSTPYGKGTAATLIVDALDSHNPH